VNSRGKTVVNVLYLTLRSDFERGGQISLAHLIESLPRDRFNPILCLPGDGTFAQWAKSQAIQTILLPPWSSLRRFPPTQQAASLLQLRNAIRTFKPAIIHVDTPRMAHLAWLVRGDARLVIHLRVPDRDGLSDRLLARETDGMIAISSAVARRFEGYSEKVRQKIEIIYNPIDTVRFKPVSAVEKRTLRQGFGLPINRPVVVMMAAYVAIKRHDFALDVWRAVTERVDAHLVFAGSGDSAARQAIERRVASLGLQDRVQVLGHVPDPEKLLSCADLFLLTSTEEGFGRVAAEAGACGVPAIVPDYAGHREVVEHGVTGMRLPVEDPTPWVEPIVTLLADAPLRRKMGRAACKRVEETFSVKRHVERVMGFYSKLLGS